eukprot:356735-Chlamydomonas_euryale.AAC.4
MKKRSPGVEKKEGVQGWARREKVEANAPSAVLQAVPKGKAGLGQHGASTPLPHPSFHTPHRAHINAMHAAQLVVQVCKLGQHGAREAAAALARLLRNCHEGVVLGGLQRARRRCVSASPRSMRGRSPAVGSRMLARPLR